MSYYNTNKESGEVLKSSETKARTQEDRILEFFRESMIASYSPSEILTYLFNGSIPITSVRRAMTNLTIKERLQKTDRLVRGMHGKKEHVWELVK